MRRMLAIATATVASAAALISLGASSEGGESYLVRAVFDNGSFVVPGEDVRIAGANVGSVDSTGVAMPDEPVSKQDGAVVPAPGKAILVLNITDPGFRDFRQDATCLIRPPSLLGERFVDCRPTLPRAPGSPPPPPLQQVSEGQPGAGQFLLPLENNGTTVDLDLINNIQRRPYAERFRLILNELGAGLAARGPELAHIIRRGNPALRDANRVLHILASQSHDLARLAADSDAILAPLARERRHVSGFIDNAGAAAQAAAERGPELQAALTRFPRLLDELQRTMGKFRGFSDQALPVASDLNQAAPDLARATRKLTPLLNRGTVALNTLGDAAVGAGPDLEAIQPLTDRVYNLGTSGRRPLTNAAKFLASLRDHKGFDHLMDLIYNTGGSVNGFDEYGHFLRSQIVPTNCVDYTTLRFSGCNANFLKTKTKCKKGKVRRKGRCVKKKGGKGKKGTSAAALLRTSIAGRQPSALGASDEPPSPAPGAADPSSTSSKLLDFLLAQ